MTDIIDDENGIAHRDTETARHIARFDSVNSLWYPYPDDGRIVPGIDASVVLDAMVMYHEATQTQLEALRLLAQEAEALFTDSPNEEA